MRMDNTNIYEQIGEAAFWQLSRNFYDLVFNDEEQWFRNIFKASDKQQAIRNQVEFFIQRMGGPPLYSERKGHPALIARHLSFNMNEKAAERWISHMRKALDTTDTIPPEIKEMIFDYCRHTAWFLSIGVRMRRGQQGVRA